MNPQVETIIENNDTLTFTLSGVNVSLANAIRRTILSDIPIVVFRTSPIESNKAKITVNTSRLNNEILKQRLSCIPIHISDLQMPLQNYIAELNKENLTDTLMYVTTEDFRIKNVQTGEYLSDKNTKEIWLYLGSFSNTSFAKKPSFIKRKCNLFSFNAKSCR